MKKLITLSFIFVLYFPLYSQIEKGDWMLDLNGLFDVRGVKSDFSSSGSRFSVSLGYMVSDKLMLGSGINFVSVVSLNNSNFNFQQSQYQIAPFIRYYVLEKNKLQLYSYINSSFTLSLTESTIDSKPWENQSLGQFSTFGGLGISYFIAPNIAVESQLGTLMMESGNYSPLKNIQDGYFASVGIRTYIHDRFENPFQLKENYLRKGNQHIRIGGCFEPYHAQGFDYNELVNINGIEGFEYVERKSHFIHAWAEKSRFITDRLSLGGGFSIARTKGFSPSTNWNYSLGINGVAEVFLPINDQLFFSPSFRVSYTHDIINGFFWTRDLPNGETIIAGAPEPDATQIESINGDGAPIFIQTVSNHENSLVTRTLHGQNYTFDLSPRISYFTKRNYLLETGLTVSSRHSTSKNFSSYHELTTQIFIGAERFFVKNLSVFGQISFNLTDSDNDIGDIELFGTMAWNSRLNFGMRYFIFNEESI